MTLQECYKKIGADYDSVIGRLMNERIVKKFVFKFQSDPSFRNLEEAVREKNWEEAFRAAHTLKGICGNLSFSRLAEASATLTDVLREKNGMEPDAEEIKALADGVRAEYEKTMDAIRELADSEPV